MHELGGHTARLLAAWGIAWVLAGTVGGCFHPDKTVHLKYEPLPRRPGPSRGVRIEVGSFEDRRPREEIGVISSEEGVLAHARSRGKSVSEWVEEAFAHELGIAGFDAVRTAKGAATGEEAALRVTGDVLDAEVKQQEAVSAEVRLRVTLWRGRETLYTRTYRGSGGVVHVWGTGKEFNAALSKALGGALGEAVTEIRAFVAVGPS
ncbi:MAG: hypothetical protein V2A58_14430 [Planctomycetota bacterium]